jgi:hypothetical protein
MAIALIPSDPASVWADAAIAFALVGDLSPEEVAATEAPDHFFDLPGAAGVDSFPVHATHDETTQKLEADDGGHDRADAQAQSYVSRGPIRENFAGRLNESIHQRRYRLILDQSEGLVVFKSTARQKGRPCPRLGVFDNKVKEADERLLEVAEFIAQLARLQYLRDFFETNAGVIGNCLGGGKI